MYGRRGVSRKMRLVPIDSTKNIVQFNTSVASGAVGFISVAVGVDPSAILETNPANVQNVEEGASIRGFVFGMRVFKEDGVADSGSTVIALIKCERNLPAMPLPLGQMNSLGTQLYKNKIFHIEQAIVGSQVSGLPMAFPSIKIPKRFHKMANTDVWNLVIANNTTGPIRACGVCIYKWYK